MQLWKTQNGGAKDKDVSFSISTMLLELGFGFMKLKWNVKNPDLIRWRSTEPYLKVL
jgi:hypothetical protein